MGRKKKEKVIYVDDGRTIADMSGVSGPRQGGSASRPPLDPKAVWKTYWGAVKMMIGPMLAVICALCILYMILYAVFSIL